MTTKISPLFSKLHEKMYLQIRVFARNVDTPKMSIDMLDGIMRVLEATKGPGLSIKAVGVKEDEATPIESIFAAEDAMMALADEGQTMEVPSVASGGNTLGDHYAALAIYINRAANIIAARTRRGSGNVALMSPKALAILSGATTSAFKMLTPTADNEGRWKHAGTLSATIQVYTSEEMDENTIIVAYVGASENGGDGPGEVFKTEDGLALYVLADDPSALGNAADYLQKITLTNV